MRVLRGGTRYLDSNRQLEGFVEAKPIGHKLDLRLKILMGAGLDVVKDEPVNDGNPLLMEPRIFVTPHIAGSTDLMLDGTVSYLGNVLAEFRQGIRSGGIVNEPGNPRVAMLRRLSDAVGYVVVV